MKDISHVDIVFENLEYARIAADDVVRMQFKGLYDYYPYYANGMTGPLLCCEDALFMIRKDAKGDGSSFYEDITPCERIKKYKDITSFEVCFENGGVRTYYPEFSEEGMSEFENRFQKTEETEYYLTVRIKNEGDNIETQISE